MVVVDGDMTKLNVGAPPRERGLGEGQSLAAEPMEDAAEKAMSDKEYEEGEDPVGAHNVMFGVGDAKADSSGRWKTGYRSSGEL